MAHLFEKRFPLLRLRGMTETLGAAEGRLANFILDNPRETMNSTIEELVERSGASYATIIRFCKKMGFAGYKDFKAGLFNELTDESYNELSFKDFEIPKDNSLENTVKKIYDFSFKILRDSYAIRDITTIEETVEAILGADYVYFIGAGTSGITARYAFSKFFRIGITCSAEVDMVMYRSQTAVMPENGILFAISSSGRTAAVVKAARNASKRGITVISLSDYAVSPLTETSDINLFTTPRNANLFIDLELPLIIGQITLIDVLFACTCSRIPDAAVTLHNAAKEAADDEKV